MAKDLTTSQLDRQNILNNDLAVDEIQKQTGIQGVVFEGRLRFTKSMVAIYFDVDIRTVERYVSENSDEMCGNGYEILKGKRLKEFMKCVIVQDVPDINVGNISSRNPQILFHIQNDGYYPTFLDKLEHLFFCACKFHCFSDGNKRIAITLTAMFLLKNGYMSVANVYFREMENISYHVAAGHIDEDLLKRILDAILNFTYDTNEELKLDIFNAISVVDEFY